MCTHVSLHCIIMQNNLLRRYFKKKNSQSSQVYFQVKKRTRRIKSGTYKADDFVCTAWELSKQRPETDHNFLHIFAPFPGQSLGWLDSSLPVFHISSFQKFIQLGFLDLEIPISSINVLLRMGFHVCYIYLKTTSRTNLMQLKALSHDAIEGFLVNCVLHLLKRQW